MKLQVPLAITFVVGLFMAVEFFVPHELSVVTKSSLLAWARIVGAFALVLGIGSLLRTHTDKIRRRRPDWLYSIATLVSFFGMCVIGLVWGHKSGTRFDWVFHRILVPLDATMFSLLAFFIASAAFRTFRARSVEATLLLVTAVVVMLGRVPSAMTIVLGDSLPGLWLADNAPDVCEWIMSFPSVAGRRGIIFGTALGVIATSLRIILGIERSHLGGSGGGE